MTKFNLNSTNTYNLNKLLDNQQQHHQSNDKDLNSSNGNLKMNSNGLLTTPNRSFSKIKFPILDAYKQIHSEIICVDHTLYHLSHRLKQSKTCQL